MNDTSWLAYGLIAHFSHRLEKQRSLGKTKLQKLVYLLEKLKNVSVGYDFCFYTYGPFSSDLAADLDYVNTVGGVRIDYEPSINMFEIKPGENVTRLTEKSKDFLVQNNSSIEEIVDRFGSKQAKELELLATLVFVAKSGILDHDKLVKKVKELKPRFSFEEIENALEQLKTWEYIE